MSALGEVLAPAITGLGACAIAYVTARTARGTQKVVNEGQVEQVTTEGRLLIEDKAYQRAESYWENALRDARREVDETRTELVNERRERREEHDVLNGQLTALRLHNDRQVADLRTEVAAATRRAERAEDAARALARRTGQPEPDL